MFTLNTSAINALVADCNSTAELDLVLSCVKLAIKNRKAEIKTETIAAVKKTMTDTVFIKDDGSEGNFIGQLVTVKAPASFGAPTITGIVSRIGDKTFTITTTAIATATGKPKNLARNYSDFICLGDAPSEFDMIAAEFQDLDMDDEVAV